MGESISLEEWVESSPMSLFTGSSLAKFLLPSGTSVAADKTRVVMVLACHGVSLGVRHMCVVLKLFLPAYMGTGQMDDQEGCYSLNMSLST